MGKLKGPILIACVALFLLAGCKARTVKLKLTDSTSVSETSKTSDESTSHKDTGKIVTNTIVLESDSGNTETTIIPVPGKPITVAKDGTFTGEAKSINVKNKKASNKTTTTNQVEKKAVEDLSAGHITEKKRDSTHVQTKTKDVVSKPSYVWLIYVGIGAAIIALIIWLYIKFKPKIL